jgi:predicted AlkP superfamily phosphohydrolase/phosphomutase
MCARAVVFGVDGLTFRVLHPLIERGELPHFQYLQQNGCEAVLEAKYPPFTPPAWTSLATGLKPAKHGVFDFWDFTGEQGPALVHPPKLLTHRKDGKALWNIMSEFGKKVLVINVPMTYPPEPVNGIMISGYMTPDTTTSFTFPASVKEELFRVVPAYEIDLPLTDKTVGTGAKKWRVLDATLRMTENRFKLMEYMLKEKDWDFCFLGFVGADRIQHRLWDEITSLDTRTNEYYHLLDDGLGRILSLLGPGDCLYVVSDHGFQGVNRAFEINEYLYSKELVTLTAHSQQVRTRNRYRHSIRHALKHMGLFDLVKRICRLYTARSAKLSNSTAHNPHSFKIPNIDWEHTLAFMPSSSGFGAGYADIFLSPNLDADCIAELRADLLRQVDPQTGRPLLEAAMTGEVFGRGPYAPASPRLLLLPNEGITFRKGLGNTRFWDDATMANDPTKRSGVHQKDGVLYAYGKPFKQGFRAPNAEVYDLAPTVLYAMGLSSSYHFDGRILEELFLEQEPSKTQGTRQATRHKLKRLLES